MSCIASSVSRVSTSGSMVRNRRPPGPSTVPTPSVVIRRYPVRSGPTGSRGEYANSGMSGSLAGRTYSGCLEGQDTDRAVLAEHDAGRPDPEHPRLGLHVDQRAPAAPVVPDEPPRVGVVDDDRRRAEDHVAGDLVGPRRAAGAEVDQG